MTYELHQKKEDISKKSISNIRDYIWKIIDSDVALKKDLTRGIINVRALANYIIREYKLKISIDSVISAIRRYNIQPNKSIDSEKVYDVLKTAKINTVTKVASLSLKKSEYVHEKISELLPNQDYSKGEVLRVIEGARIFRLIFDQKDFDKMQDLFTKKNIISSNKKLAMIEIIYSDVLEKTPGVFSLISNELAESDISIIDALICSNEHIIVIDEKNLIKCFDAVFNLCN